LAATISYDATVKRITTTYAVTKG